MHIRLLVIVIYCLFVNKTFSQYTPVVDSIRIYLKEKPQLTGDLGSVQTFFYGFKSPIWYATGGLSFSNRIKFGAGYARLFLPDKEKEFDPPFYINHIMQLNGIESLVSTKLRYEFILIYADYIYYKTKHWKFSTPIKLGIGRTGYVYSGQTKNSFISKKNMIVYNPSVSVAYAITKWFGLSSNIGFLVTGNKNKEIRNAFSSPVFNFGLYISYSEIYRTFVNRKK